MTVKHVLEHGGIEYHLFTKNGSVKSRVELEVRLVCSADAFFAVSEVSALGVASVEVKGHPQIVTKSSIENKTAIITPSAMQSHERDRGS